MTNSLDVKQGDGNTTLIFDREFLDKILPEAAEYRDEKLKEDGYKPDLKEDADKFGKEYHLDFEAEIEDVDIDGERIAVIMTTPYSEIYISVNIPLGPKHLEQMTDIAIKKLNQAKVLFQAVKK